MGGEVDTFKVKSNDIPPYSLIFQYSPPVIRSYQNKPYLMNIQNTKKASTSPYHRPSKLIYIGIIMVKYTSFCGLQLCKLV